MQSFLKILISEVPFYNGYDAADNFMYFFKRHLNDMSVKDINSVMSTYRRNGQCMSRSRHSTDIQEVNKYLQEHKDESDSEKENG